LRFPMHVIGSVSINGGDGDNSVATTDVSIGKSFAITNATGNDSTRLNCLNVFRSLTINNGNGDSDTRVFRDSVGMSAVGGSLNIANGTGADLNSLSDTYFGSSVTIYNGHGRPLGPAGNTSFTNVLNTNARSVVRGSVTVSYLDGDGNDRLSDTDFRGNVTINAGTGKYFLDIDHLNTAAPTLVRGNLTVRGSGRCAVSAGTAAAAEGLSVGKNFTVVTGPEPDFVILNKVDVGGATRLSLGGGENTVAIDDSTFVGSFALTTGSGNDLVSLDATTASVAPTVFGGPVVINLVAGDDTVNRAGTSDPNQLLIVLSTFIMHHGLGNDTDNTSPTHEFYPFGTSIQWVI
jgi:hypothetical protein